MFISTVGNKAKKNTMENNWKRELFLDRQFEANAFKIGKVSLNSSIENIDYMEIVDIYVDKKGYEQLNFSDRIELLKKHKGWIHYASGASFEIKKGIVKQIKLSTRFFQNNKTKKSDIIKIFGKPDKELIDDILYSGFDYNIDAYILVYRKKNIYAFIHPKTEILIELHFGDFNESYYGKK